MGQTGRCLNQRLKEHRHAVESGDTANSALAEHACSAHKMQWTGTASGLGSPAQSTPKTSARVHTSEPKLGHLIENGSMP